MPFSPLSPARRLAFSLGACVLGATAVVGITDIAQPEAASAATDCRISPPDSTFADEVASSARYAQLWRLYQAYFLRQPDNGGLGYWIDLSRSGVGLQAISDNFELSEEFALTYGALDNYEFLELIYANVLCRIQDGDGFDYWLGLLNSSSLSRGDMMVLFSESEEYLTNTNTGWSVFSSPDTATLSADGYELRSVPGGQIAVVDYDRIDVSTSHNRCSVASINANWFFNPESSNPTPVGFAVIDGVQVPGAANRADRGVLGERYRPQGETEEIVWVYQGSFNINSNLASKNDRVLESWHSWRPDGTPAVDNASEWRWAAAGIPLIIDGQVWPGFYGISTSDYTHYTHGHSFVAFDKDTGYMAFGSTTGMTSAGLINWANENGYEDLIKFDGGGSVEFNVNGQTRVAGTGRNVPVWLGIGC